MWWFIAGWLLVHWRWSYLKTTPALVDVWQDSETSLSKSSLGNFQHWYLADMLASVYSYCIMVKSISSCCVPGRQIISNPVTYTYNLHICTCTFTWTTFHVAWSMSHLMCATHVTWYFMRVPCVIFNASLQAMIVQKIYTREHTCIWALLFS